MDCTAEKELVLELERGGSLKRESGKREEKNKPGVTKAVQQTA